MTNAIRIAAPNTAAQGEIIELKALIQHPMESGFRRDSRGEVIPREIITAFECLYNDTLVFSADFHPAVAANPFLTFHMRATESGSFLFRWKLPTGEWISDTRALEVT